jgi:methyl-accepting chemotaxis protein
MIARRRHDAGVHTRPRRGASLVNRITLAAVLAVLACAAIVGAVATWLAIHGLERQARQTLAIVSNTSAARLGDWIAANQRLVSSVVPAALASPDALPPPASPVDSPELDARLQQGLTQQVSAGPYHAAFMAFEADHRYVRVPAEPMPKGYNPTERPWYKQAVAQGTPMIPPPYRDVNNHEMTMTFEQVVRRNGKVLGVLGALTSLADVTKIIAAIKPTPHSYAFVVDGQGRILIHPDTDLVLKPARVAMPWLPAAKDEGAVPVLGNDGRRAWVRTAAIPNSDWKLTVVCDRADTLAGLNTLVGSIALTALLIVAGLALLLARWLGRTLAPLRQVRDAMVEVADGHGDLTTRIQAQGTDEVSEIAGAFNAFAETLRRIMAEVQAASAQVKLAADEIAAGNQDLSSRTELQAGAIQESAGSMHQITEVSASNASHAHQANRIAQETAALAEAGGLKVYEVVSTMHGITESSRRIGEIIGVIDGIAFQTNILALNAAVEAARAGEQGRGFAVVASAVRNLAQRSAGAARDVRALIGQSATGVAQGAARVDAAGQTIARVVHAVRIVSDLMAQIVDATEQQSGGIRQVMNAVSYIDTMTQQNAALVEQASAAAQSLRDQSSRLTQAVGRFRT